MQTSQNRKDLIKDFENSLEKPHNYLRIANQYLQYLIENDIELSIESKYDFLENKAAVYKTALNKFFKNCIVESETPFCVFELVEEKQYLDIDNSIFDGLAESSKETYYNIISEYKSIYKDSLNLKEFESYINSLYKKDISKHTVSLYYSAIKKYFECSDIWVRFSPKPIESKKTDKYILSEIETSKIWNHIIENYDLEIQCIFGLMIFNGLRSIDTIGFKNENSNYITIIKGGTKVIVNVGFEIKSLIDKFFTDNKKFRFKETSSIRKYCNKISKDCLGLPIPTHSFRHSLSVNLRKKGIDLKVIKELLNHKSFESTAHYTQENY